MNNGNPGKVTFGLIVGNRGFFPSHLALSGRKEMIAAIEAAGHAAVWWGMLLIALGAIYVYRFAPRKGNK